MPKKLTRLMSLFMCLVIFTGAVACSGGKGASGQKVDGQEVQQGKSVVSHGKDREKLVLSQQLASERVVVENNALGDGWNNILPSGAIDYGQSVQSYAQYAQDKNLPPEQVQADLARMVKGDLPESANIIKAILENNPGSDTVMAVLTAKEAKDYALALLTSIPAEKALSLVGKAAKVIDNKILISAAEKISTAKPGKQSAIPRDLNEQIVWKQVQENPAAGEKLLGMNNDPRFPASAGFQKMQVVQKNSKGESITIHYQYNSNTGKAYDMKVDTPQRVNSDPADVIENIKGQVK